VLTKGRADVFRPLAQVSDDAGVAGRTDGSWSSRADVDSSTESGARWRDNRSGSGRRSGSEMHTTNYGCL